MKDILLVDDLPEALALIQASAAQAFPGASCNTAGGVEQAIAAADARSFELRL